MTVMKEETENLRS